MNPEQSIDEEKPTTEIPGIGRLGFFIWFVVWAVVATMMRHVGGQRTGDVLWLVTNLTILVPACAARLINIGCNAWWCLLCMVPGLGLLVAIPCLFSAPSHAQSKKPDLPPKIKSNLNSKIMNTSDPTTPTEAEYSPTEIQVGIKVETNTMPNQISEEPAIPCNRSTYVESRSGAMGRIIMKTLRMVIFFAIFAPISFALVGLGCLVAYKGTIHFYLPEEIEKILRSIQPETKTEKYPANDKASTIVAANQAAQQKMSRPGLQPDALIEKIPNTPRGPISADDLRREYYGKAGVSAQWVQEQLYGTPGDIATFSGDSMNWTDKQSRMVGTARDEQNRYNNSADRFGERRTVSPLTAEIIRMNIANWAQTGRFPSYECKLAYYLALNCKHYENGTVNEEKARNYLDKVLAQILPQIQHGREQAAIAALAWEKDRPAREMREAMEKIEVQNADANEQYAQEAAAQREQLAQLASEQAAMQKRMKREIEEANNRSFALEMEQQRMESEMRDAEFQRQVNEQRRRSEEFMRNSR